MMKIDHKALPHPEDVCEQRHQQPNPNEEQEEPEHRPEHLTGAELS